MSNTIVLKSVSKVYHNKSGKSVCALDLVDLEVKGGEFVAVLGPSGCGKSSLLLSVGGLLNVDSGQVVINGRDITRLNKVEKTELRADHIAYVFQEFHLIPYLSILDNVRISELMGSCGSEQDAVGVLAQFGMEERADHLPSEISVGEQQRVAIARAIYSGASIILADEPTGNLDPENTEFVLHALKSFAEKGGIVVMVSHDERAVPHTHRSVKMLKGRCLS
jgi:ABC-type lipoprotein export system ATPase subunit